MSMRILCLSYEYPPIGGGGAPVCAGVAEALTRAGHRVDVVTTGMPDLKRHEKINGVRVWRVPCYRRHRHMAGSLELASTLLPMYRMARQLTDEKQYDLIHCHFILPTGIVARRVSRATGIPYILTAHGSDVPGYNPDRFHLAHWFAWPMWRRVVRGALAVTSPSRFLASLVRKQLNVRVRIVPNGMTLPPRSEAPRANRVLLASRLFERKGVQDVVRAMEGWSSDWQVDIAGDGPYRPTLERLARERQADVTFLKLVPHDELTRLYRTSKIFVFPSHRENFPVVLLEAMSAGCAMIVANTPGNREVVGDAAVRVEPGDSGAIRAALRRLTENDAAIAQLRERSYQRVQRFAWERVAGEYEALFRQCLGDVSVTLPRPLHEGEAVAAASTARAGATATSAADHDHEHEQASL